MMGRRRKYYLFLTWTFCGFGLLLVGCAQDHQLEGHWHLIDLKARDTSFQKETYHGTFDYPETYEHGESFGIWDKGIGGFSGMLSHVYNNEIIVVPTCFGGNYTFKIEDDSLRIFDDSSMIHVGYKCAVDCCDKQKEFFLQVNLNIELSIEKDTTKSIRYIDEPPLVANLFLGTNTHPGNIFPNSDRLTSSSQYLSVLDIPIFIEKHKVKIPENKRHRFSIAIFPNADSGLSLFSKVLKKCNELGFPKVYIALKEDNNHNKEFKVRYREIETNTLIDAGSEMTIEEWLNLK